MSPARGLLGNKLPHLGTKWEAKPARPSLAHMQQPHPRLPGRELSRGQVSHSAALNSGTAPQLEEAHTGHIQSTRTLILDGVTSS